MTPRFRILANSRDITAAIRARCLSLTVSDRAGLHTDTQASAKRVMFQTMT